MFSLPGEHTSFLPVAVGPWISTCFEMPDNALAVPSMLSQSTSTQCMVIWKKMQLRLLALDSSRHGSDCNQIEIYHVGNHICGPLSIYIQTVVLVDPMEGWERARRQKLRQSHSHKLTA